ncbi:MAG: cyclic nucleotide-binding domain-containing protein [Acidimicrobiales bacterium]
MWKELESALQVPSSGTNIWDSIAARADPASWRPFLDSDVEIATLDWAKTGPSALVARGSTVFGLDACEVELLPLLDGGRSVAELIALRLEESGELNPSAVVGLVAMLRTSGFLKDKPPDVDDALARALERRWQTMIRQIVRTLSVEWAGADRLVRFLYIHGLRRVVNIWGAALGSAVALAGLVAFGLVVSSHPFHLTTQSAGWGFLLLMSLNLAVVFVHELGHATAIVHNGRSVKSAGIRIYYGAVAFFVDAPQALLLNRRQRILRAFAGPWFEAVAGGVAALVLWLIPLGGAAHVLYRFVVVNYIVLGMNLLPVLELDGYLIFSDAIGVPDLRSRSLSFLRRGFWHKIARRQKFTRAEIGLGFYALVGLAFAAASLFLSVFFWRRTFGGVISVMWHAGPLGIILLFVLAAVVLGPLLQAAVELVAGLLKSARVICRRTRFRIERSWRIEAAQSIDGLDLFDDIPVETLNELAGRVQMVECGAYETVFSQGDEPDGFFVVRKGEVVVEEELGDSVPPRVLTELGRGQGFGEMALIRRAPRTSTVRAAKPSEIFRVDNGTFDRLLAPHLRMPEYALSVQQIAEIGSMPCLRSLEFDELANLVRGGEWISVPPNTEIVTQGDAPDGFYLILDGQAEVCIGRERVSTLKYGDHFGEIALVGSTARTATVRSLTPLRAFRLSSSAFYEMIGHLFSRTRFDADLATEDWRS